MSTGNELITLKQVNEYYKDLRGRQEAIVKSYEQLTFPVNKGTLCIHDGSTYISKQDINNSEPWTSSHWTETNIGEELTDVKNDIHELQPNASMADVGKYLKAKTISNGRVTEYELTIPSGGGSKEVQIPYVLDGTGYIVYSNGDRNDSQNFNHTDYIDLTGYKSIKYKRTKSTSANPATGMAFYDESKQYVSGIQSATNQSDAGYESALYEAEIPRNAVYARFSVYDSTQTYGTFEIYGITDGTAQIEYNTDGHATIKHYAISRTNEDGTKAFGTGSNMAETLFFTPQKNTNYGIQVSGNNRLRVYGTHVYYDPETVNISPICADIIVESEDLTEVSFNSSDYETILIYLNNGSNETSAVYILANFGSRYIQDGVGDNSKEISEQNNLLNDEKFNLIPFISDSLPSTALLYHAEWYKLVEKGLIERSQATYTTGDANHLYPLYTYTLKAYNEYMDAGYDISSDPLSEIYERPKILVVSGHHGDEPCTPWALLNFFKRMLEDHYNADLLAQYEWTIIPMVNPYGYNNRSRYNANGVDINRDYNDSTGFASEEAQYVRNVFLADDYALTIDLHQTPFNESDYTDRRLGFTSMNEKRTGETQNEYDAIRKAFCHFIQGANAKTDRFAAEKYGYKQTKQTAFVWVSSNPTSNTFKNYTHGTGGNTEHATHFADLSITLETSTRCSYLSVSTTDYNQFTVQYTNEYVEEVIKAVVKVIEKIS